MPDDLRAELERTYGAHLAAISNRFARALAATGYDGVLIHSGSPPLVFEDDQNYPFRVNAPFKVWAPLTDVSDCFIWFQPGKRPAAPAASAGGLLA